MKATPNPPSNLGITTEIDSLWSIPDEVKGTETTDFSRHMGYTFSIF